MNKHLLKSCQEDKRIELNKMFNAYERMGQFYKIAMDYGENWTLTEYNCFWSWYYHSDIGAKDALKHINIKERN